MRILVAHAPAEGGAALVAELLAFALRAEGFETSVRPAAEVDDLADVDAVVIGGGCTTGRWHRDAHRFVRRHRAGLAALSVWLFSCGAAEGPTAPTARPPVTQLRVLARRIGARGSASLPAPRSADLVTELGGGHVAGHLDDRASLDDPTALARRIASTLRGSAAGVG